MTSVERVELALRRARAKMTVEGAPTPLIALVDVLVDEMMVEAKEEARQARGGNIHG